MQKQVPTPVRRALHLGSLLHTTGMLGFLTLGCGLAALGFALVLDVLSLRELLTQYGPRPLGHLAMAARAPLAHAGAQAGEFVAGLVGLILAGCGARGLGGSRR